jgi:hypothetical protein
MATRAKANVIKVELSTRERDYIGTLLVREYDRIMKLPVEQDQGFTLSAKAASLADVTEVSRKFGLDINLEAPRR